MDLATVKALVKAWEKTFKSENGRNPTKEDIKADSTGIAEQYSLYRRLSKSSSSSSQLSQSNSNHASRRASSSTSTSQTSRATPRTVVASEYPTTPTPPTRRSSGRVSQDDVDEDTDNMDLQPGPSTSFGLQGQGRSLKRTASKAALNSNTDAAPRSPASKLLTSPKKRPYTGPIHDPNPINPFAASPLRKSAMKSIDTESTSQAGPGTSPFFHATSPMKLKELLQENSLRKVQERNSPIKSKEITPRTKARKRLTGEIDETPAKSRVRRKRGAGGDGVAGPSKANGYENGNGTSIARSTIATATSRESPDAEAEMEDEFGPTPIKSTRQQESFYSFFERDDGSRVSVPGAGAKAKTGDMVGRLLAAGGKGKQKATEQVANGQPADQMVASSPDAREALPVIEEPDESIPNDEGVEEAPAWSEDEVLSGTARATNGQKTQVRPEKTLTISDDEIDEWDPEASHVRHRVKIVPTRSRPTKQRWSDDDDELEGQVEESAHDTKPPVDEESETIPPLDDTTTSQTKTNTITSPPPLLSLLSLTSPNHRQGRYARLKELRYKALFNPSGSDAQRLKAFQKGQEAFLSGETEEDDETRAFDAVDDDNDGGDKADMADDDWESESEGWKRTGVEMDDDAW